MLNSIYIASHHIEIDLVVYIQVPKNVNMITEYCAFTMGVKATPYTRVH